MHNLLTEPLIRYKTDSGELQTSTLPQVYAALVADDAASFPALRPHQRHAWHAFLVQLGAMALHRAAKDGSDLPTDADEWVAMIRGLTPDWPDDEPWQLVVDDITKPAFMQPPASSKERQADFKASVATPDELDMLVTSKNHDLKAAVADDSRPDDWVFALVTLQTMEGYGGRYNYGVSRMPSGYGNRPAFSFAPSIRPGIHVKHDLITLLNARESLLDEYEMTNSGIGLLWVIPWDGAKSETLVINQMGPFYIEICRRVRLRWESGQMSAIRANSNDRRISDAKGLVGDPWMPVGNNVNPKGTPPTFLGRRKFGYERVVDGLSSADWKVPLLLKTLPDSRDTQLVARGMVRGEGGTDGYHERIIPIRYRTLQIFGRPGGAKTLEDISRERIERIAVVQRILRHAVSVFAAGGKTEGIAEEQRGRANSWANRLADLMDADFFEDLQDEVLASDSQLENVRKEWLQKLEHRAATILREAIQSLPCPDIRRLKAQAQAENVFWGRMRGPSGLTELYETESKEDN